MRKIAVVDDDYKVLAQLTSYFDIFYGVDYEQDDYSNGFEFVNSLSEERYDIVFINTELRYLSGIEAISELRKKDKNCSVAVIFLAETCGKLSDLFHLHPADVFMKPFEKKKVYETLRYIENIFNNKDLFVQVIVNRKKIHISISDIVIIRSDEHLLWLTLCNNTVIKTHMKLETICEKANGRFIRIHTSYAVNRRYIEYYDSKNVTINGEILPISKKYRDSIY